MSAPLEMTARDLRALARLVDERKVVVVCHRNLLAVLRPEPVPNHHPTRNRPEGVPEVSSTSPTNPDDLAFLDGGATRDRTAGGGFAELFLTERTAEQREASHG